jgi:serine phosphatase RsbU (regulator of sigma subunit)
MVVQPEHEGWEVAAGARSPLDVLAGAAEAVAAATSVSDAARELARAAARAARASVAVARVASPDGRHLVAVGVAATAPSLAAELEGTRLRADELPRDEIDRAELLPEPARRIAERTGAEAVLLVPVHEGHAPSASVELYRHRGAFSADERRFARVAAYQLVLAARALGAIADGAHGDGGLTLAGDALTAAADAARAPEEVTRLAAEAAGARASALWRAGSDGAPELVASFGFASGDALVPALATAADVLRGHRVVAVDEDDEGAFVAVQLGQPVLGVLQLRFEGGVRPSQRELARLTLFGARAAHALRASAQARTLAVELDRTRALLAVVGQAIAQLSLAHTLETAVGHVAELLGTDRLAVYLRSGGRLEAAAGGAIGGPHLRVAERLLDVALGPFRARGIVVADDVQTDPHLRAVAIAAAEAGIEGVIAVPLLVADDVIGLLAVYPPRGRRLSENEAGLLAALASRLAVAVQNAQLHERAKRQEEELKRALAAERASTGQLRALYEISASFTQYLAFERTLAAVAKTFADVLGVDAAVLRLPDERREVLLPRALHIPDERLAEAAHAILDRPQPFGAEPLQRLFRERCAFRLDAETARAIGDAVLVPFLEKGWTAAVVPVHTPTEVIGALEFLSVRPGRPVTQATVDTAVGIAAQAALAIDNARLYQQQKEFADAMQRSLLPHTHPQLEGLELGAAYASSARVDVGGDVYDFLELPDGRLAIVLGDVTGHGVDATADMAMAKFVFRSLAREHSEPSDFLASANDVVVGEIAVGKFITMVYLVADPATGTVVCAGAGHPPPRVVSPEGEMRTIDARGLALGVDPGQTYDEVRTELAPGDAVVLYTDGVVEARRGSELFGTARLDRVLRKKRGLAAELLADEVLAACREFAEGELSDDCAVVVLKRI